MHKYSSYRYFSWINTSKQQAQLLQQDTEHIFEFCKWDILTKKYLGSGSKDIISHV